MTSKPTPLEVADTEAMSAEAAVYLLQLTARLLLEYSARTETIERQMERIAKQIGLRVTTSVAYREVTLFVDNRRFCHVRAPELRLNAAVNLATLRVIDDFCSDRISVD